MPGSGALRMALGALKDSTTLGLATLNTHYRELEMAIILATNHSESPPKERHINAIFTMISASRPRSNIAHCIRILGRRLSKTNNWAVALKTLIVIHRALRQVGPTFRNELFNYGRSKSHVLYLSNFKDNSSQNAWDYSAWVRAYALFLEERLECFYALKFDVETECSAALVSQELHANDALAQRHTCDTTFIAQCGAQWGRHNNRKGGGICGNQFNHHPFGSQEQMYMAATGPAPNDHPNPAA
ncbi:hypothetical protein AMTR_s00046p00180850 [Amborella trichopoda]|uniref:ENTH domain-containing protein n=1 Tax=Amborella trichopoda TaxID=13333 RepID=U5CXJ2_AMBTC|nr:hypothetical protein AMTR_s00046p00180850 [Amborella trichopoda]